MDGLKTYSATVNALDLAATSCISHFFLPIHVFRAVRPLPPTTIGGAKLQDSPHDVLVQIEHQFHRLDKTAKSALETIDKLISGHLAPSAFHEVFLTAVENGEYCTVASCISSILTTQSRRKTT